MKSSMESIDRKISTIKDLLITNKEALLSRPKAHNYQYPLQDEMPSIASKRYSSLPRPSFPTATISRFSSSEELKNKDTIIKELTDTRYQLLSEIEHLREEVLKYQYELHSTKEVLSKDRLANQREASHDLIRREKNYERRQKTVYESSTPVDRQSVESIENIKRSQSLKKMPSEDTNSQIIKKLERLLGIGKNELICFVKKMVKNDLKFALDTSELIREHYPKVKHSYGCLFNKLKKIIDSDIKTEEINCQKEIQKYKDDNSKRHRSKSRSKNEDRTLKKGEKLHKIADKKQQIEEKCQTCGEKIKHREDWDKNQQKETIKLKKVNKIQQKLKAEPENHRKSAKNISPIKIPVAKEEITIRKKLLKKNS